LGPAGLIAVVGGGPAGAAAAVTARAAGREVVLYDASPAPGWRAAESLPPGGEDLVREVFAPGAFRPERHLPAYANTSAWGTEELERAEFVFNPLGAGWHLDRRAFDSDLLRAAAEQGVNVRSERATDPRASFVVDATGRSARIARTWGAQRVRTDRLVAAIWTSQEEGGHATSVAAVPDGWWYTSPVPRGGRIEAFLTDADLLPRTWARRPRITDAATTWLDRITGPGWLATGDAAAAFDPLSSQGIITALAMGRSAGLVAAGELDPALYEEEYTQLVLEHLALRDAYYALETRWPEEPFWSRRGVSSGAAVASSASSG
jgi:flavin-dependent dehydrogenase